MRRYRWGPFECGGLLHWGPLECGGPLLIHLKGEGPPPLVNDEDWTTTLQWQGLTSRILTFRVTVAEEHKETRIAWRRWGGALIPYSSGIFKGSELFRVYPGDVFFRVDLASVNGKVNVTIEPLDQ